MNNIRNNKNFKIMMICSGILVTTPVSVLFYQAYGIAFEQIMIIKTATFISTIIFEVPSGYIADRFGYKKIIQAGLICLILSCIGNITFHSIFAFISWGIIWGIGNALLSGADEAWYYNFLKEQDMESEYGNNISQILAAIQFISAIALILSSAIFVMDERLPFIFNTFFFAIALGASFRLSEKKEKRKDKSTERLHNISVWKVLNANNIFFVLAEVVFVAVIIFTFEMYQPQMTECNIPVSTFGLIYFCFTILTGFGSRAYGMVKNKKGEIQFNLKNYFALLSMQGITLLCLCFGPDNMVIVLILMCIQEFLYGVFNVYSNAAINSKTDNSYRATLISIKSLLTCGSKSLLFLVAGKIMDLFYLKMTYLFLAVILLCSCILLGGTRSIYLAIKSKEKHTI